MYESEAQGKIWDRYPDSGVHETQAVAEAREWMRSYEYMERI